MRLDPQDEQSELKKLVQQNIALTEENLRLIKKVRRHFLWDRVFSIIKIAVILAPLIAAGFYLRPYLAQLQQTYQQILGIQQQFEDIGNVANQLGETQKKLQNIPKLNNQIDVKNLPNLNQFPLDQLLKNLP